MADERVRIDLVRSGGLAGLRLHVFADTDELPLAQARELRTLVADADLPALARRRPGPRPGPDRFQYDLVVQRDDEKLEISLGETEVTPQLRPLLERLIELARR